MGSITEQALKPAFLDGKPKLMLIDGKHVAAESGKTFQTINPTTGKPLADVAQAGPADIDKAVAAARRAFDEGPWRKFSPFDRQAVLLKLADLQSHGALVLGQWQPWSPRDWAHQECTVRIGAGPIERRRGTHALGDPLWVLPEWLRHLTRRGAIVPAETVVTTGTWCGMLPAEAGDLVVASFEGVGEASLQL